MFRTSAFTLLLFCFSSAAETPTYVSKQYAEKFYTGAIFNAKSQLFSSQAPHASFALTPAAVPASFSLRGKTGQIEHQGSCGSCWDFGLTTALRGTLAFAGRDPGRLSFNYLLNCNPQGYGCAGGGFDAADSLLAPFGPPRYGDDGDYTATQGYCVKAPPRASATQYFMLGQGGSNPSFKDIAYVVGVLHRSVAVAITAESTLMSYAGGIYNGCAPGDLLGGNHMVVIEGYDCESSVDKAGNCEFNKYGNLPRGIGLFVVRNSWGKNWGDHGYLVTKATDPYGQRCNGIGTYALYFDPK